MNFDDFNLNGMQREVVYNLHNNILLNASAGTGKTNVLSLRIMNIISQKLAKPDEILCLTFTKKAANEMYERVLSYMPDIRGKIHISTIHAFGYKVICETDENHLIFDDEDVKAILNNLSDFPINTNYLIQIVEKAKQIRYMNNFISDNMEKDFAKVFNVMIKDNLMLNQSIKDLIISYQKYLNEVKGLDYKDLIGMPLHFFRSNKSNFLHKFKYIMIDEFQDTSIFEYEMLLPILRNRNVLFSGDLYQTIYMWRGSSPYTILEIFKKEFAPVEIFFKENYRFTKILSEFNYQTLRSLFLGDKKEVPSTISKSINQGEKVHLKIVNNEKIEAQFIADEIKKILPKVNSPSEICILSRYNKSINNLKFYLDEIIKKEVLDINFSSIELYRFFKKPEIKLFSNILSFLLNKDDDISLKRFLLAMNQNYIYMLNKNSGENKKFNVVNHKNYIFLLNNLKKEEFTKNNIRITDFINEGPRDSFNVLLENYKKDKVVIFDVEATGLSVKNDYVIQIAGVKLKDGEIVEVFDRYIKAPISVGNSEEVHKISDEYLAKYGEDAEVVFKDFLHFIKDCILCGHNIKRYDLKILAYNYKKYGLNFPDYQSFDTLLLTKIFYKNLPSYRLENLCKSLQLNHQSTHNALDDVKANAHLFNKLITEKIIPQREEKVSIIKKYYEDFKEIRDLVIKIQTAFKKNENLEDFLSYLINEIHILRINSKNEREVYKKLINYRSLYKIINKHIKTKGKEGIYDYLEMAALSNEFDLLDNNKSIPIITIHQGKGLEFKYVFLVDVHDAPIDKTGDINLEEKNIFYVGITRAKQGLYITSRNKNTNLLKKIYYNLVEER